MNTLDENYMSRLFEDFSSERNKLILELKNDKEMTKERILTQKLTCIDNLIKNILKYRNINIKEKMKGDL